MRWWVSLIAFAAFAHEWQDITPKPDLGGWSRGVLTPSANQPWTNLVEPSPWSVEGGVLQARGSKAGHEWLRYDRELGDFELSVEWRLAKLEGEPRYNSGVFVRNSRYADIWHQVQVGGPDSAGFLFQVSLQDGVFTRTSFKEQQKPVTVHPAGEWNRYDIRVAGCKYNIRVNGELSQEVEDCALKRGFIGLEAEGFDIEFRNIRLRELPTPGR
jgi:hypothetical protein